MGFIRIYKDWLINKIIIRLKGKPFHVKTPVDYLFLSLKASGHMPEKVVALELFGMYGLYVTKHYSHLCESVELWELDAEFAKYAKKFSDKNVKIIQGDSVKAVQESKINGKFNLLMIDNPLVSPYGEGLFEHFNVMPEIFGAAQDSFVLIFNIILSDPEALYNNYGFTSQNQIEKRDSWIKKRKEFYESDAINFKPQEYIRLYIDKFKKWGLAVDYSTFLPRNERVGFLGFVLTKVR
jgi:hypothetical protein